MFSGYITLIAVVTFVIAAIAVWFYLGKALKKEDVGVWQNNLLMALLVLITSLYAISTSDMVDEISKQRELLQNQLERTPELEPYLYVPSDRDIIQLRFGASYLARGEYEGENVIKPLGESFSLKLVNKGVMQTGKVWSHVDSNYGFLDFYN